ncbi:MAG: tyrosine--tRNA ligase, partial [Patescibacteria group bacterium]
KYNSKWLGKMSFADVIELSSHFTVQRMLERDMFQKRFYGETKCENCGWVLLPANWEGENVNCPDGCGNNMNMQGREIREKKPIYLHEFLYPMMQGYDSVAMDVDGEVGGNDQTFNMLVGRDLMKELKGKEKFVLTTKLLTDSTGKKMGKSEGNMISLADAPEDMFGKVMSWPDDVIGNAFELCTTLPMDDIASIVKADNPRDAKLRLAFEITKTFLGEKAAKEGQEHFASVIQKKGQPNEKDIPIFTLRGNNNDIITVLFESKLCLSRTEARRAIAGGGVYINDERVKSSDFWAKVKKGDVVQKGKLSFVRVG